MRISSNYYNYYNQGYNLSAMNNTNQNTTSTNLLDSSNDTVSSSSRKSSRGMGNAMMLNMNGSMMKYALQSQDYSEMAEKMDTLKTDMENIKSADIDKMSEDSLKELLTKLQNDLQGLPRKDDKANEILSADIGNMTETDMREMLKKVQEDVKNAPEIKGGRPPRMEGGMPPMMQMMDLSQIFNSSSEDEDNTFSIGSSSDMQNTLQQILDKLTESYDSTTADSDDYVAKLKESLEVMFDQQRSNLDSFSSMIFDSLDQWSSQEKDNVGSV